MDSQEEKQISKQYKSLSYLVSLATCFALGNFYMGYSTLYFNTINFDVIMKEFNITMPRDIIEGVLSGTVFLGSALGAIVTGPFIKFLSRRQSFYFVNIFVFVGGILVLIPNVYTLIIGRLLQGIAAISFSIIVPVLIKQMMPLSISGSMLAFQGAFVPLGMFCSAGLVFVLSLLMKQQQFWIIIFSFTLLIMGIQIFLIYFIFRYETPKYYLLKGKTQQAQQIISKIYLEEYQQQNYHRILKDLEADNQQLEGTQKQYPKDSNRAIFLAFLIMVGDTLTSSNVIIIYSHEIIKSFAPKLSTFIPTLINLQILVLSILALYVFQRFGRKQIMVLGSLLIGFFLITFSIGLWTSKDGSIWSKILIIGSIFLYLIVFSNSWSLTTWIYPIQILQPLWFPYLSIVNSIAQWIFVTIYPILRGICSVKNCPPLFLALGIIMILIGIILKKLMVQTKDKSELQIREQFNSM